MFNVRYGMILILATLVGCASSNPRVQKESVESRTPAQARILKHDFSYSGVAMQIQGEVSALDGKDGILINKPVIYGLSGDLGGPFYLGGGQYMRETYNVICAALGYEYSRETLKGASIFQKGIFFYEKSVQTARLSNQSYAMSLACAHERVSNWD